MLKYKICLGMSTSECWDVTLQCKKPKIEAWELVINKWFDKWDRKNDQYIKKWNMFKMVSYIMIQEHKKLLELMSPQIGLIFSLCKSVGFCFEISNW